MQPKVSSKHLGQLPRKTTDNVVLMNDPSLALPLFVTNPLDQAALDIYQTTTQISELFIIEEL